MKLSKIIFKIIVQGDSGADLHQLVPGAHPTLGRYVLKALGSWVSALMPKSNDFPRYKASMFI